MFEFKIVIRWEENFKDKMITFIDLYRKNYEEPVKDIKYERNNHDSYRMIITYKFEDVDITFESVDADTTKWITIKVEVKSDSKSLFDEKYSFIVNTIEKIK